jgi:teichuronic acid biosynthesis glycosyltransferase TuaG
MVLFTILTPIYNGVEFFEECFCSIINQTYTNWELLIGINGHGNDGGNVYKIVKNIVGEHIKVKIIVQPPPLSGKVESMNNLMTHVSNASDWIAVLDCDDKWESTKLEEQYNCILNEGKNAHVIGTYCKYFGDRNGSPSLPSGYIEPEILEHFNPIINSSAIIKKELCYWEYNNTIMYMEDYILWMNICLKGYRLYNIPRSLTYHRIYTASSFNSKKYTNDKLRNKYKIVRKLNSIDPVKYNSV